MFWRWAGLGGAGASAELSPLEFECIEMYKWWEAVACPGVTSGLHQLARCAIFVSGEAFFEIENDCNCFTRAARLEILSLHTR